MKKLFLALLVCTCLAADETSFDITLKKYTFSTAFELESNHNYFGTVVKNKIKLDILRTHYEVHSKEGNYEGQGIVSFCSTGGLGFFYTWAKDICVYDEKGELLGYIDGEILSTEQAKFTLSDYSKEGVAGCAYLDENKLGFTVVDPKNSLRVIATLKRVFVENTVDYWHVEIFDKEAIDPRILKIFAAFAVDTQGCFKKDT